MDDLNNIASNAEKEGRRPRPAYLIRAFNNFLTQCRFIDLESKGCSYTCWSNHQPGEAHVKERLDRAVENMEWKEMMFFLALHMLM